MQTCVRTALDDLKEFMKVRWFLLAEKNISFGSIISFMICMPAGRNGERACGYF